MSQQHSAIDFFPQYDDKGFFSETPTETSGYPSPKATRKPTIDLSTKTHIPEPWLSGGSSRYAVPKKGEPWEKCFKKVKEYDEDMFEGWREEVDNLLIFAGLFSSVLTAFVIESYHGLQEDPNEKNTFLLEQLLIQAHNGNAQGTPLPTSSFSPTSTNIRVNVFWFTSLSLSLATVLLGILCMQWLREYQRNTPLDPKDAISLRQLRYEGLIAWKVPDILMLLPVLLHFALLLFFLGLIDLLWSLNHTVAFFVSIVSGLVLAFLLATSFLPALQIFFINDNALRRPQCAYKSPQSWAFHRMVTWIVWSFGRTARIGQKLPFWHVRYKRFISNKNWVDHDLAWYEARRKDAADSRKDPTDDSRQDIVQGLAWIDKNLGQTVDMIYAVYHCIRDLPSAFSQHVVSQISEKTQAHLNSKNMTTYLGSTSEEEHREIMAALFLELNNRTYPQLDQYQVESVVSILNSRLHAEAKEDHNVPIMESFPFVNWPVHIRTLPAELISQFLLCVKHLVQQGQLPQEREDDTWIMIQGFLSSPSTGAQRQHAHLALEIIAAFESNLPTVGKSEDDERKDLSDARRKVRDYVGRITRVLSQGELGDLEPSARRIVSAIRSRMESVGGTSVILLPEEQKRWNRMVKGVSGDEK
ncbi:hypothetical protein M413DRAFT_31929 [Hebeloma cylindrosporum]|uniref:DUF6535 domain-containing protein n=1 Tax=Hebeloma cylindrosporum TaxID=76867 RepID=A0A0C3BXM4_HEBCY|nr:hypothetical protein M413DRAFT_31929 [Hebeloma cylindrosporum h7]